MSPLSLGLVIAVVTLIVLFSGMPVAFALGLVSVGVLWLAKGWGAVDFLSEKLFNGLEDFTLVSIPMFVLMGAAVASSRAGADLYEAFARWLNRVPGSLVVSNLGACALFAALTGSSPATCAAIGKMGIPEMQKRGYRDDLATGAIAAGGTLGILIPPSVIMVIYGILTETSIGRLFIAGIVPGVLGTFLLCVAVVWIATRDPQAGPPAEPRPWAERLRSLIHVWPAIALFALVIGGIYLGWFTATEGAGIGAGGGFLFALARRALTWRALFEVLIESARTTSMLFMILIGALMFAEFVNITTMPGDLRALVTGLDLPPVLVVGAICVIYVILGTAMEELSMVLLTIPVFFPVVVSLGFDPIWFGVVIVCVVEIGLISPPVGMNMFVLKSLLPQVPTGTVFSGVMPFFWADVLRLALLVAVPWLALWLPGLTR